jgi:DNA-binding transcriptional LysR family regulator
VETGSFTAAATHLGLPKSSVSRGVAMLESSLGVRLLQRTTRRLSLTEAGRAFHDAAAGALAQLDEAQAAATEEQEEPTGIVRITASVDIGVWLLAPVMRNFLVSHPRVRADVVLTPRVVDLVQDGFDLALRAGRLADNRLVARPLGVLRAGLFAHRDYLKQRGVPKTVAQLAKHECLTFRSPNGRATWELIGPAGVQKVEVGGALNSDGFDFILAAVSAGMGIGLLPMYACQVSGSETLVRVLPEHATTGAPLHLVYPSSRYVPRRVAALRDRILAEVPPRLES